MANPNKTFVLHDESLNTYGFRMLTSGANLEEFRKNPVMLLNHNDYYLPIGRWENIRIEGTKILADAHFDMADERAREVARKVNDGFIKAASIGAWPPEEQSSDPLLMLPGQKLPTITKWTVREASICTIGANHNALTFYDRQTHERIDLQQEGAVLQLMDKLPIQKPYQMNLLNQLLSLADNASENEQLAAIRELQADHARLKTENTTLKDAIDKVNADKAKAAKEEAIALVDAAVRDGRINADGRDHFLSLFDKDPETAKIALSSIQPRTSVHTRREQATGKSIALADQFKDKTWDELDREGCLVALKDNYPDLYSEKFEQRFGVKPNL